MSRASVPPAPQVRHHHRRIEGLCPDSPGPGPGHEQRRQLRPVRLHAPVAPRNHGTGRVTIAVPVHTVSAADRNTFIHTHPAT